jgi:type I restriction enzyme S subunit
MTAELIRSAVERSLETTDESRQLRGLVLELAIRGLLTKRDSSAEPAKKVLQRVADVRALSGSVRGKGVETRVNGPFVLPQGWEWATLAQVFVKITDGTHHSPSNGKEGDFRYVTAKDIKDGGVSDRLVTYVTADVHNEIFSRCDPELGDILYVKDGATTGVVTVNNLAEPFSMLSSVALLKTGGLVDPWYMAYAMRSPFFYAQTRGQMSGVAIPRVTLKKLDAAFIPIPPPSEQVKIATATTAIMQVLDDIDTHLVKRRATQRAIPDALLEALLGADALGET